MFRCKDCVLEYNRDSNGSVNIGNRLLGYMLMRRADVKQPQTPVQCTISDVRGEKPLSSPSALSSHISLSQLSHLMRNAASAADNGGDVFP